MASFAKQLSLFLLLITLLSSQARESQFFNKASPTTNNDVVPHTKQPRINQQEQPDFLPENENAYGLYGHDSGQFLPSSATTNGGPATTATPSYITGSERPVHKYLPKNYNPVAYVTEPEDINESTTFTDEKRVPDNNNNFYDGAQNYYNTPQEKDLDFRNNYPSATNRNSNNYYYNGGGSLKRGGAAALSSREEYFSHGGAGANGFEPQGMSDTRLLENGKYFYDVNTEKYSSSHPYESLKGVRERKEYDNRNYYGDGENEYELNGGKNSMGGYQNQYEFQDEENYKLRP